MEVQCFNVCQVVHQLKRPLFVKFRNTPPLHIVITMLWGLLCLIGEYRYPLDVLQDKFLDLNEHLNPVQQLSI